MHTFTGYEPKEPIRYEPYQVGGASSSSAGGNLVAAAGGNPAQDPAASTTIFHNVMSLANGLVPADTPLPDDSQATDLSMLS